VLANSANDNFKGAGTLIILRRDLAPQDVSESEEKHNRPHQEQAGWLWSTNHFTLGGNKDAIFKLADRVPGESKGGLREGGAVVMHIPHRTAPEFIGNDGISQKTREVARIGELDVSGVIGHVKAL